MIYPINIKGKTKNQVTKLNLSNRGLASFPENVFDYPNLTKLVLSNNKIKTIPKEILQLKKLRVLDLANNEIKVLHSAVFQLPKLTTLNVYGNKISKFPKQVMESGLKRLIVGKNPIEDDALAIFDGKFQMDEAKNVVTGNRAPKSTRPEPKILVVEKKKQEKNMEKKNSIFISYSHKDKKWLKMVQTQLVSLKLYNKDVEVWSDEKIMASDVWKEEITKALEHATIAILIVSSDFMASEFIINEELQPLLDKSQVEGTKILTLVARPIAFFNKSPLSKYQTINDPKQPLSGMTEVDQEWALVKMAETIDKIINTTGFDNFIS